MMKKSAAMLLALMLCVGAAVTALAAQNGTVGDLSYTLEDNGLLTISGDGAIPANAFRNNSEIVSVIISEGVKSIGGSAFSGCKNLVSVKIAGSVTDIGNFAFSGCTSLEIVEYEGTSEPEASGRTTFAGTAVTTIYVPAEYSGDTFAGKDAVKQNPPSPPADSTKYTVTVSASPAAGGSVSGGGTVEAGEEMTVTAAPKSGYEFVNWTKDGVEVSTDASCTFTVTGDAALAANFKQITYAISLVCEPVEGGSLTAPSFSPAGELVTVSYTCNPGYELADFTVTDSANNELQLSTPSSGMGDDVDVQRYTFLMPEREVTAKATFFRCEYEITFDPNGGDGAMRPQVLIYGQEGQSLALNEFTREGYEFVCWNTEPDGSGEAFGDGAALAAPNYEGVLYAQWKEISKVTVNVPSGTGDGSYLPGEELTITAEVPDGKQFVEWMGLDGVEIIRGDKNCSTITIRVPEKDLMLVVLWKDAPAAQSAPPATGDDTPIALWLGMMMISLCGMFALRRSKTN